MLPSPHEPGVVELNVNVNSPLHKETRRAMVISDTRILKMIVSNGEILVTIHQELFQIKST